jgi:hypothetical protein
MGLSATDAWDRAAVGDVGKGAPGQQQSRSAKGWIPVKDLK